MHPFSFSDRLVHAPALRCRGRWVVFMHRPHSFASWITGLPASGKSTIVSALRPQFKGHRLGSDEVRREVTPTPTRTLRS